MRRLAGIVILIVTQTLWGCLPWMGGVGTQGGSLGTTSSGLLVSGQILDARGLHFGFYRRGDRRYGTRELTGLIERASQRVAAAHPGSVLLVGEMSSEPGGFLSGHRSHRSGRDVDLAFFSTNARGLPDGSDPSTRFDRFGIGVIHGEVRRFDAARNWELVEALITDVEAEVQWIFVSNGLKAMLLKWALGNDKDLDLIEKAASILSQPSDSAAHDDHFHVRIYCPKGPRGAYCVDRGPVWPWVAARKRAINSFNRDELTRLALENI